MLLNKKGKGFPYSISSVGPGADPGVQAVSPQVTVSHSPGGRLPLLATYVRQGDHHVGHWPTFLVRPTLLRKVSMWSPPMRTPNAVDVGKVGYLALANILLFRIDTRWRRRTLPWNFNKWLHGICLIILMILFPTHSDN